MANYNIPVYMNKDLLETVAVLFEDYPKLHDLLSHHAVIYIDLTQEELDAQLSDFESDFALFQREFDIDFVASHDKFREISTNPDALSAHCREVLFLEVDEKAALSMGEQFGLIIHSQSIQSDPFLFPFGFQKALYAGDHLDSGQTGWSSILSRATLLPRNSIVINDRHLFDNEFGDVGYKNILACLRALLPQSHTGTFQITIVSRHPRTSDAKCNQLGGRLKADLKATFNYDIKLEIFFLSDTIHKRRIFLGYQTIKCDKGFGLFKSNEMNVVREDNEFELLPAFSLNGAPFGDSQYAMDSSDLSKILKQCKQDGLRYRAKIERGTSDQIQLVGDYNKTLYEPSNRLLQL